MSRFDRFFPPFMYTFYTVAGVVALLYGLWPLTILHAGMILGFWWICNRWPLWAAHTKDRR